MGSRKIKPCIAILVSLAIFGSTIPAAMAGQQDSGKDLFYYGWTEAKKRGPILWYVRDEQKRRAMEEDLELLRLHNEANKAKKRRTAFGNGFLIPGIVLVGLSAAAGIFQHVLGFYDDETGQIIMIAGVCSGISLIAPGLYLRAKTSKAEKDYMNYVREKYDIIPILKREPDGSSLIALNIRVAFP